MTLWIVLIWDCCTISLALVSKCLVVRMLNPVNMNIYSRPLLHRRNGLGVVCQFFRDLVDLPSLADGILQLPRPLHHTLQGKEDIDEYPCQFSLFSSYLYQYLGMCLLLLHIMERDDLKLDWKVRVTMVVFAPFSQMTFLATYIYYWRYGDTRQQVGRYLRL